MAGSQQQRYRMVPQLDQNWKPEQMVLCSSEVKLAQRGEPLDSVRDGSLELNCRQEKLCRSLGHTPSTAGTFRKKFRKNSGKTPETLSERFLEFPSRVRLGCPKPYNSRHLRLPERFQNSLPPSTAGDASFSRIGSGEGLSELVMEFPAVLGVFLKVNRNLPPPPEPTTHTET